MTSLYKCRGSISEMDTTMQADFLLLLLLRIGVVLSSDIDNLNNEATKEFIGILIQMASGQDESIQEGKNLNYLDRVLSHQWLSLIDSYDS